MPTSLQSLLLDFLIFASAYYHLFKMIGKMTHYASRSIDNKECYTRIWNFNKNGGGYYISN